MKKQISLTAKGSTISMMKVDGEDCISKLVEFDQFKNEAGTNAFVLPLSANIKIAYAQRI